MFPQVLTPLQESKSLNAKKAKAKRRPLKQTLVNPYTTQYRPTPSSKETERIINLIAQLPRLVAARTASVQWWEMKLIPKAERKEYRLKFKEQLPNQQQLRKHLTLGINAVTEALEKHKLDAVLITDDVNPFFLVQHVIDLCILGQIPVLLVLALRKQLDTTLGIASTCIGITNDDNNATLGSLCKEIRSVWEHYPPSENLAAQNLNESCVIVDSYLLDDKDKPSKVSESAKSTFKQKATKAKEGNCKNLHLKRSDTKSRVFVPERVKRSDAFNADFIRFSAPTGTQASKEYIGMQVSKLVANSKRAAHGRQLDRTGVKQPKLQPNKFKQNSQKIIQPKNQRKKQKQRFKKQRIG